MARIRLSTAVDAELLGAARRICVPGTDASMVEEAPRLSRRPPL